MIQAKEISSALLAVDPEGPDAELQTALSLWEDGEITARQAGNIFRSTLPKIQPSAKWLRAASRVVLKAKQVDEAILYADQAIACDGAEYDNYAQKADCLMAKKDFDGAEQALIAGAESGRAPHAHYHTLSKILTKAGRLEEAVEAERQSLRKYPEYFDSLFNVACLLSELQNYPEALQMFKRALRVAGPHEKNVKAKITALPGGSVSEASNDAGTASSQPLGYSNNYGGLTNQKFALLGLITDAYTEKRSILLPKIMVMDHVSGIHTHIPMGEVFDLALLFDLFDKYEIKVGEGDADDLPVDTEGEFFSRGATKCGQFVLAELSDPVLSGLVGDYFRCLTPLVTSSYIMAKLIEDIFTRNAIEVVAQFRVESDWLAHCDETLRHELTDPEDYQLTFDRIVAKIVRTLPNVKKILVLSDEAAVSMAKSQMADVCRARFGVELFWKSDFLTQFEISKLNNLELSMIDFELALRSKHYIGMTRSTFSNAVTSTKYILSGKPVTGDYIYNNYALRLARRTDNGGSLSIEFTEQSGVLEQVIN